MRRLSILAGACMYLQVACGGCHMIALAHKADDDDQQEEEEEILDPMNTTFANSLRLSTDGPLGNTARDRRRAKEVWRNNPCSVWHIALLLSLLLLS